MSIHKLKRRMMSAIAVGRAKLSLWFACVVFEFVSFMSDVKASGKMIIGNLLGLILGVYVAGATLPDAITYLTNATKWANVTDAVATLGTEVAGIVIIIVFIVMLLKSGGLAD